MHAHRRWVLAGHPSLHAASLHAAQPWLRRVWESLDAIRALVEAAAKRWGIRLRKSGPQAAQQPHAKPTPLPRPPGIGDDHPLVLNGRYR